MVPEMSLYQTTSSLHSEHLCKSVNPHRHCATDTSTRKHSNRAKTANHGNPRFPQPKQITIMDINTTSLRRPWPSLAREKHTTRWTCTEVRMLKEHQLWFSERYTKEDKISVTWGPPMDRREDGQPEFGGTCIISRQPAFSISGHCAYHETLRWLLTTKRFLMVRIPIGNGSKNVTDTKTRQDFALVNEAFRAAVTDFEVMLQNFVPKHKGLNITLNLDAYEQKVWMMRQPTTLNAEDQQLLEHTLRNNWKQASQEYEQAIMAGGPLER